MFVDGREKLSLSDTGGARRTRSVRYAAGLSKATDLKNRLNKMKTPAEKEAVVFACAAPEYSYNDAFELFTVAVPRGGGAIVRDLKQATTINGIKFSKGRRIIFCRDLSRLDDDPERRTFVQEDTIRAVEARMLRWDGIHLDDAGLAPRAAESSDNPGRLLTLSEELASSIIDACDV